MPQQLFDGWQRNGTQIHDAQLNSKDFGDTLTPSPAPPGVQIFHASKMSPWLPNIRAKHFVQIFTVPRQCIILTLVTG